MFLRFTNMHLLLLLLSLLSISANSAVARDFGLRHIASVKCCPYIMLLDHGPEPLHIVWTKKGSNLSSN